jgi:hypothetical protein
VSGWETVVSNPLVTVAVGNQGSATATCSGSKKVLGGGCRIVGPISGVYVQTSAPSGQQAWLCEVENNGVAPADLSAHVICADMN